MKPGDIVRSVNTGFIVRVVSVESDGKYFAGVQIGNAMTPYKPERFHWFHPLWVTANFVPVEQQMERA